MPEDGAHMHHMVVIRMVEIWSGMHWTVRRRHRTGTAGACVGVTRVVLRMHGAAAALAGRTCRRLGRSFRAVAQALRVVVAI